MHCRMCIDPVWVARRGAGGHLNADEMTQHVTDFGQIYESLNNMSGLSHAILPDSRTYTTNLLLSMMPRCAYLDKATEVVRVNKTSLRGIDLYGVG